MSALILGGGPAGAAAALMLARGGAAHLLLDRALPPRDALCGGFLSWRTLATLERLGVGTDALNREPVRRVRLFAGRYTAEAALPRAGLAVSRHRLDIVLRAHAVAAGARIEQGTVRSLEGRVVRLDDATMLESPAIFLATGKHELRGGQRPVPPGGAIVLGLRTRLARHPALDQLVGDAVELHLFGGGYAGIARQEDGSVNLCIAVHRTRLTAAGSPAALLAALGAEFPRLGERLAHRAGGTIDAVANVPYGWRARDGVAGLFRLGDQAAVIPSLAGEGIGIALASGIAAADAYARHGAAGAPGYQRRFSASLARPFALANAVRRAAEQRVAGEALVAVAALAPRLVDWVARHTRVPAALPWDATPSAL